MSRCSFLDKYWRSPTARRRWIEGGLILSFWTAVALLMIGSRVLEGPRFDFTEAIIAYFFLRSYWWALATPLIFYMARRFSLDTPGRYRAITIHLVISLIISIAIETTDSVALYYIVSPPWAERITLSPLAAVVELNFLYEWAIYLSVLAAGFARDYFMRFEERRKLTSELQDQLAQARLSALRMQINPHFLFNTLHAMSSLVERDPKGVRRMVAHLSDLLRYTLDEQERHEVPLEEELDVLSAYFDIQKIRFQGNLEIQTRFEPGTEQALVPPLILQPIVENSVIHGVNQTKQMGYIILEAQRVDKYLVLTISDNGPGVPDPTDIKKGLGLSNTEKRLDALYGDEASLSLDHSDQGGLRATIRLPFHEEQSLPTSELTERYAT